MLWSDSKSQRLKNRSFVMNDEFDWKRFFDWFSDSTIEADYSSTMNVEELYQAFKGRLITELKQMMEEEE